MICRLLSIAVDLVHQSERQSTQYLRSAAFVVARGHFARAALGEMEDGGVGGRPAANMLVYRNLVVSGIGRIV